MSTLFSQELNKEEFNRLAKALGQQEEGSLQQDYFKITYEAIRQAFKNGTWAKVEKVRDVLDHLFNSSGRTLLIEAIIQRDEEMIRGLIEKNIAILTKDVNGDTPLHHAARHGSQDFVNLLLKYVQIDTNNNLGQTPLHVASDQGQTIVVKTLLDNGAPSNLEANFNIGENKLSLTSLQIAVIRGHKNCVDLFFESTSGKAYLQENPLGNILHFAIKFGKVEMLKHLLNFHLLPLQSLINKSNADAKTPLMVAAFLGEGEALCLLIQKEADIEEKDLQGRTALHWAAIGKQRNTVELLAYFGANLQPLDANGKRPVDYLKDEKDQESQSLANFLNTLVKQKEKVDQMPPLFTFRPPENLIFKGGGVKGLAYVGAIKVLEEKGLISGVKRVSGTSAGAITSTLLAMQYDSDEIQHLLSSKNMKDFLDHPFTKERIKEKIKNIGVSTVVSALSTVYETIKAALISPVSAALAPLKALFSAAWNTTGLCKGEDFRKWMEERIKEKTGKEFCTFRELRELIEQGKPFKHLHIFVLKLNSEEIAHIHSEDPKWDNLIISDIVRASMSIPGVFEPHTLHTLQINPKDQKQRLRTPAAGFGSYVDGGLIANFPIEAFDKKKYQLHVSLNEEGEYHMLNKRSLGFSLYSPQKSDVEPVKPPETVGDLLKAIVSLYWQAEELIRAQVIYNKHRVIDINNLGIGTVEFGIKEEQKQGLIDSGKKAALEFFEKQEKQSSEVGTLFLYPKAIKEAQGLVRLRQADHDFVGRSEYLQKLKEALLPKVRKNITSLLLWGDGGIGKSEIANAFANTYFGEFSLTYWIDCGSRATYEEGYRDLGRQLRIPMEQEEGFDAFQERLHRYLEEKHFDVPYLLILDNTQASPNLPGRGNGAVIMTSRSKLPGSYSDSIEVKSLNKEEAVELIRKILRKSSVKGEENLAKRLSYHPLALNQAAHYIATPPVMAIEQFLKILEQNSQEIMNKVPTNARYPLSFAASWYITAETLSKTSPIALEWLHFCSYLYPEAIPSSWASDWLEIIKREQDASQRELKSIDHILRPLATYSLIHDKEGTTFVSINWLKQELIQNDKKYFPTDIKESVLSFLLEKVKLFTNREVFEFKAPGIWKGFEIWEPHAGWFIDHFAANLKTENVGRLCHVLGSWKELRGRYIEAQKYLAKAVEIYKNLFGERDPRYAASLHGLAWVLARIENNQEAKKFFEEEIKLFKKTEVQYADALHGLAWVYGNKKDYPKAKECFEEVLAIREKLGKRDEANRAAIIRTWNDLGWILEKMGKEFYDPAQKAFTNALEEEKEFLKEVYPNHPYVASTNHNLGRIYEGLGAQEEAKRYHAQALKINQELYGKAHVYVIRSLDNLIRVLKKLKDKSLKEVEELKKESELLI